MASAFETLSKILALEAEEYRNRAVIGGIERFIPNWREQALAEAKDEEEARLVEEIALLLADYPTIRRRRERAQLVRKVQSMLQRLMPQPPPRRKARRPTRAAPKPPPREAKVKREAPPTPPPPPVQPPPSPPAGLQAPVTTLPGIGPKQAARLARLGVHVIEDFLYLFPHRHNDYSAIKTINKLTYGETATIIGTVWEVSSRESRSGKTIISCLVADGTGTIEVTWFNRKYLLRQLKPGRDIVLSGKVELYLGRPVLSSPEWEPLQKELVHTGRLVPVYPLTEGINIRWLRRLIKRVVDHWAPRLPDHLPPALRKRMGLMELSEAIAQIHFPDDKAKLEQARRRLSFDEFFFIQLGMLRQRHLWRKEPGRAIPVDEGLLRSFLDSLPFSLTGAQERALREILADMAKPQPMSRLLQGDVGSGKTVVAAAAMLMAASTGFQAVMMAPTEILAEQHYKTIGELLERIDGRWRLRLLVGSLKDSEKERIREEIAQGEANLVVGTHALIQAQVSFKDLGLAVIDEQHRFGVAQRAALRQKGYNPHVLVMSATPIPRTLALTIYGDLDISVIDEMPPGRRPVKTVWLTPRERERAYSFIRRQVEEGRQAFIICPLIEESEAIDARAAVDEYERLQKEVFPDLKLGLLHGRMKGPEKEEVMAAFKRGEFHILVSTPVVEVGIDVPNATVILVEGADRFGLAQLHQFRGRVGRGEHPSYCLLLAESPSEEAIERLKVIETVHDGFLLAEKDLEMRGPGEFFGTRQSGLPDLKVARLSDLRILEQARAAAQLLFQEDPELTRPEHRLLAEKVARFWKKGGDLS